MTRHTKQNDIAAHHEKKLASTGLKNIELQPPLTIVSGLQDIDIEEEVG